MRFRKTSNKDDRPEQILVQSLQTVRDSQGSSPPDLAHLKTRLEASAASQKENSIMARLTSTLGAHPKVSVGVITVVAFVLFTALVPLPYTTVVGYTVRLNGPTEPILNPNEYLAALNAAGVETASVNVSSDGSTARYTIENLETEGDARQAVAAYRALTNLTPEATITPVTARVSGTLAAQAMEKWFRVEVQTDGKTDAEIAAEIAASIEAQGGTVQEVRIETSDDGEKSITIDIDSNE